FCLLTLTVAPRTLEAQSAIAFADITIVLAKGGNRAMVMRSGECWHCINPVCGCVVVVEANGEIEGQNQRCACSSVMMKDYSAPVFRYLDFLKFPEPELTNQDSDKDSPVTARAVHHAAVVHPPQPLAVRAGLARTFGSLAGFVV